jgi:four helix bundle protein
MRVYERSIEMNRQLAGLARVLERKDRDLLRQLKRAASSVVLNIAEGMGTRGGNRELRFVTALGSANEVRACLAVAEAWGYVGAGSAEVRDTVEAVVAMLVNLTRARR